MFLTWTSITKSFEDLAFLIVDVFTTGKKDGGFHRTIVLFLTCSLSSLLLSALLLLYLFVTLDYSPLVAGAIAGCFGTLLAVALFLSKRVRCLGTLFVISVFMKKSRSLLLTAGTSLVVLKNIRNTLENLSGLLRSVICNFRAKKAAIKEPFANYVKMLKWIGDMLKGLTDFGVVNFDSQLKVSPKLESEKFRERLAETEQKLNETLRFAQSLVRTVSSVADRMFPAISFLVLMIFIGLHVKKYRSDVKYKNRYITGRFVRFDEKQKAQGKAHVLPLTPVEGKLYVAITSARPTSRERKALLKFGASVASHLLAWVIFITVDALLYCFVDIVTTKLSELEPIHVPLLMSIKAIGTLIGIKVSEEKHQEDFSYSVTLFEKHCLPKPKLLLSASIVPLAVILLVLLIMALVAAKFTQLRLMVCERFFTTAAEERVEHLHRKIVRRRLKRKTDGNNCSGSSLFLKPSFWCPLLFQPRQEIQSVV